MRWDNIKEIVENLEENYPDEEPSEVSLAYLEEMVRSLNEFEDHDIPVRKERLKEIWENWNDFREQNG